MGKKNNINKSSTDSNKKTGGSDTEVVPDEFKTVIFDFINDFSTTFPEYSECLEEYFTAVSVVSDDGSCVKTERLITDDNIIKLYTYCKDVYPARFFDILYKNGEIFDSVNGGGDGGGGDGDGGDGDGNNNNEPSLKMDVHFLPKIDFTKVWNTPDISDNTRNTIWKYLQLILFSIITNISDRDSFGETAKLFEAINEDELKTKLEETFKNMQDMFMGDTKESGKTGENVKCDGVNMEDFEKFAEQFKNLTGENGDIDMSAFPGLSGFPGFPGFDFKNSASGESASGSAKGEDSTSSGDTKKKPEMPNPETIHEHISKLLNGKIGSLAKEIAEETAGDLDLGIDMDDPSKIDMGNVFQKLFKNPGKLMNMVKNVGKKLDDKFKNGDIKESEIMQEASDLLSNMKNMPGMGNLTSMLNQLGMSGLGGLAGLGGKGGKVNMGALQSHFQQNMKQAKMKERMLNKLQQKQQPKPTPQPTQSSQSTQPTPNRPTTSVFKIGEQIQQTPRPIASGQNGAAVGISTGVYLNTENENKVLVNTTENSNAEVLHKKKKKKNKK